MSQRKEKYLRRAMDMVDQYDAIVNDLDRLYSKVGLIERSVEKERMVDDHLSKEMFELRCRRVRDEHRRDREDTRAHMYLLLASALLSILAAMVAVAIVSTTKVEAVGATDTNVVTTAQRVTMPELTVYDIEATEPETALPEEDDMDLLARMVWGEARGCSAVCQAAVVWCVLNRCEDDRFPATIREVVTANRQFFGYDSENPVDETIRDVCVEVWDSWCMEQRGEEAVRELPKEFIFFCSDGHGGLIFRTEANGGKTLVLR